MCVCFRILVPGGSCLFSVWPHLQHRAAAAVHCERPRSAHVVHVVRTAAAAGGGVGGSGAAELSLEGEVQGSLVVASVCAAAGAFCW